MLLTHISFAQHIWALPFMTVLAPSERYFERRGRQHRKLTDVMRLVLWQIRRWLPDRKIVFVATAELARDRSKRDLRLSRWRAESG